MCGCGRTRLSGWKVLWSPTQEHDDNASYIQQRIVKSEITSISLKELKIKTIRDYTVVQKIQNGRSASISRVDAGDLIYHQSHSKKNSI